MGKLYLVTTKECGSQITITNFLIFWLGAYLMKVIQETRRAHRRSWHGLTTPLFSNVLFTNLFSIKFLYFFIISSLFPYFNLFVSIFIQSYANNNLHVLTLYRYDFSLKNSFPIVLSGEVQCPRRWLRYYLLHQTTLQENSSLRSRQ